MKKQKLRALFITGTVILFSCGGDKTDNTPESDTQDSVQAEVIKQNDEQTVYYQIPSPDEMFDFIKNGGLSFKQDLLLPIENSEKYNTALQQSLIFGIYSADLAYTAAFEEYQTSLKYFGTVQKMADRLGISSAYDASTAERIKNNLENADSLVKVTGDTYFSVVDYLEQNNEETKLGAIATAGWIESMYIVLNSLENNPNSDVLQRIKDQKLTFENLYDYLQQHNHSPQVEKIITLVEPLNEFFNNIEENNDAKTTFTKKDGKFVLGGEDTVAPLSEEQTAELKDLVNNIRTKIIEENV
tara:strand:- start:27536 stop:28435 length:900 start_codon:yes stop_codon:yes gene_type:complete